VFNKETARDFGEEVVLVEKAEEEVVEVLCVRGRDEEGGEGGASGAP